MEDELTSESVTPEVPATETTTTTTETVETETPVVETTEETPESEEADDSLRARVGDEAYDIIKKTREEAARYRTDAKKYKTAFDGFSDEDQTAFLDAVRAIKEDPAAAYEGFTALATALADVAGISQAEAEEIVSDAVDEDESDENEFLTKADIDKYLEEKAAKEAAEKEQAEALTKLNEDIEALGYKPTSEDVNDKLDYISLLHVASEVTNGDLSKANEVIQARRQTTIDSFLAAQTQQSSEHAPLAEGGTPAVPARKKVGSIKEAAKLALGRLEAEAGDTEE